MWSPDFLKRVALLISILCIGLIYYVIVSKNIFIIPCFFRYVTGFFIEDGLKCPGCGITHMIVSELHLDFAGAFESNQMIFILQLFLIFEVIKLIWAYLLNRKIKYSKAENIVIIACIVLLILFGVARNIPQLKIAYSHYR